MNLSARIVSRSEEMARINVYVNRVLAGTLAVQPGFAEAVVGQINANGSALSLSPEAVRWAVNKLSSGSRNPELRNEIIRVLTEAAYSTEVVTIHVPGVMVDEEPKCELCGKLLSLRVHAPCRKRARERIDRAAVAEHERKAGTK